MRLGDFAQGIDDDCYCSVDDPFGPDQHVHMANCLQALEGPENNVMGGRDPDRVPGQ